MHEIRKIKNFLGTSCTYLSVLILIGILILIHIGILILILIGILIRILIRILVRILIRILVRIRSRILVFVLVLILVPILVLILNSSHSFTMTHFFLVINFDFIFVLFVLNTLCFQFGLIKSINLFLLYFRRKNSLHLKLYHT